VLLWICSICFPTTSINVFTASNEEKVVLRATYKFLAHTEITATATYCCNTQLDHDSYQVSLVEIPWFQTES
jgi:hypothetical protein